MLTLIAIAAVAAALIVENHRAHRRFAAAVSRSWWTKDVADYPGVTVIRPVKGLDAGARENVKAALDHGYPGEVETIFVFDGPDEPALPVVKSVIDGRRAAGYRDDARVIFSGPPPEGRTGKLNAMIAGLAESRHGLIAFADSDIRPDRRALSALVETLLNDPKAGAAFAPVVVTEAPRTFGDAGYALLLNGLYGPAALDAASRSGWELPFIMGQFMLFHRRVIADICGLESAEGQLVDDMYLGARVKAAGFRNLVSPHPVPIIQYGLTPGQFWKIYVRWITFSRSFIAGEELKWINYRRAGVYWVGLAGALAAAMAGQPVAAALLLLAPLLVSWSILTLHHRLGGGAVAPWLSWASFAVLLLGPFVLLSTLRRRDVEWRGRVYRLGADARLNSGGALDVTECREEKSVA